MHIMSRAKHYAAVESVREVEIVFLRYISLWGSINWSALWDGALCVINIEQIFRPSQYERSSPQLPHNASPPVVCSIKIKNRYITLFSWKYHAVKLSYFSAEQNYAPILLLTILHAYSLCIEKFIICTIFYIHAYA